MFNFFLQNISAHNFTELFSWQWFDDFNMNNFFGYTFSSESCQNVAVLVPRRVYLTNRKFPFRGDLLTRSASN